jgi:hypothetical protein
LYLHTAHRINLYCEVKTGYIHTVIMSMCTWAQVPETFESCRALGLHIVGVWNVGKESKQGPRRLKKGNVGLPGMNENSR